MGPHSNDENLWRFPEGVELSDHEKRKVVVEVVAIGVGTMFATHSTALEAGCSTRRLVGPEVSGVMEPLPGWIWL